MDFRVQSAFISKHSLLIVLNRYLNATESAKSKDTN
mgnify:CR=1 FL=1